MNCNNGIYETRTCRAYNNLSVDYFSVVNSGGNNSLELIGCGCLDAPDQIPAGSIKDYGKKERFILPTIVSRTREDEIISEERKALAERLIAELLTTLKP